MSSPPALNDLFSPSYWSDPYPVYRALREQHPFVQLAGGTGAYFASKYDTCAALLRDKRFGHRMRERMLLENGPEALNQPALASLSRMMLLTDPPDHTRLRGLVTKAFDRRGVERLRGRIRETAHLLIDTMEERREGDLVRLFNHPLPVIVICDLLGIPDADRSRFVNDSFVGGRIIDPTPMTDAEMATANENTLNSQAYFTSLFEERRARPREDLLTALVEAESEHGKLSREELCSNVSLLFAAGHETTVNLLGNGLLALYRNRDQLEILKSDPSLMPNAVEELLRYDSSVQLTGRTALEPLEFEGYRIEDGQSVIALLGAANRDPDVFDNPDRLDVRRVNPKPLSFGGGIHFCLGAQLARIEAAEALSILLSRLPNLELTNIETPEWKPTITLRGVASLPAVW